MVDYFPKHAVAFSTSTTTTTKHIWVFAVAQMCEFAEKENHMDSAALYMYSQTENTVQVSQRAVNGLIIHAPFKM